jgi:hypothetical protein
MFRQLWNRFVAALLISAPAWKGPLNETPKTVAEPHDSGPESVVFDVLPIRAGNGSQAWLASFEGEDGTIQDRVGVSQRSCG